MAITTGGGVGFSESANSRANREQFLGQLNQAQAQMQQESQFKRKQALDVGTQTFYQAMQGAQISENPEAYLGSGEGAKLLSEAGAAFSAAMGRKLNPAEVQQTGLAALSQYVAANTSAGSQAQSKAAEMMRRGLLGGPGATGEVPANTQDNTIRGGTQVLPAAGGSTRTSVDTGTAGEAATTASGVDPTAQVAQQNPEAPQKSLEGSLGEFLSKNYDITYGGYDPQTKTLKASITSKSTGKQIYVTLPEGVAPSPLAVATELGRGATAETQENFSEIKGLFQQSPEFQALKVLPTDEAPPPVDAKAAEFKATAAERRLERKGQVILSNPDPGSYQSLLQDIGSSGSPIDILNQRLIGSDRSAAQAASPFGASGLTRSLVDAEDLAKGSYVPPRAIAPVSGTPLPNQASSEPILKPGTKLKLDALAQGVPELKPSPTPKIDLATMRVAKAKIENAFDYSAEAISKMSNGKTPDQRTKAQALEVVKRVKAPHEEYKAMTDDALKASYKDTVAWYNSASPAELEAAGMSGVAGRTETMQIAKIQAQAAVDAAAARAGGDKESAWLEYKAKLLDRASTVTEQLQKLAATDKTTFFEAAKKYDFMAKTWSAYMSEAYGMPLDLNIMEQKRNLWEFISGAPKKQQIVLGGTSSDSSSSTQSASRSSLIEKNRSKPVTP